jgi:hypothetical protein
MPALIRLRKLVSQINNVIVKMTQGFVLGK